MSSVDVKKAFTKGKLDQTMYIRVPTGFGGKKVHPKWNPYGEHTILGLKCCLYGLVQAAYAFWDRVQTTLIKNKFRKSDADQCMFVTGELGTDSYLACTLWVDDFMPVVYASVHFLP